MGRLTSNSPKPLSEQSDKSILLVMAIRQAKMRQEISWLKKITQLSATTVGVLQVIQLSLRIWDMIHK